MDPGRASVMEWTLGGPQWWHKPREDVSDGIHPGRASVMEWTLGGPQ